MQPTVRRSSRLGIVIAFALGLPLVACNEAPTIEGVVTDNFGKPLENVQVSAPGSAFTTVTDQDGHFHFIGKSAVKLTFAKDGYAEATTSVQPVAAKTPQTVKLYKLLRDTGLWIVGPSDYYGPLKTCTVGILQDRDPNGGANTDRYLFMQDPTIIQGQGTHFTFVDVTDPSGPNDKMELFSAYSSTEFLRNGAQQRRSEEMPVEKLEPDAPFGKWFAFDMVPGTSYVYAPVDTTTNLPALRGRCYSVQAKPDFPLLLLPGQTSAPSQLPGRDLTVSTPLVPTVVNPEALRQ